MPTNIDPIVQSLHTLLLAAVPHFAEQARSSARTAASRLRLERTPSVSEEEARISALLSDPLGTAYEQAMRQLGEYLFAMDGSTTMMRYAAELLLDMMPGDFAARANIIDQAWNGLGQGNDRWSMF